MAVGSVWRVAYNANSKHVTASAPPKKTPTYTCKQKKHGRKTAPIDTCSGPPRHLTTQKSHLRCPILPRKSVQPLAHQKRTPQGRSLRASPVLEHAPHADVCLPQAYFYPHVAKIVGPRAILRRPCFCHGVRVSDDLLCVCVCVSMGMERVKARLCAWSGIMVHFVFLVAFQVFCTGGG